jgi:hypothetical protein
VGSGVKMALATMFWTLTILDLMIIVFTLNEWFIFPLFVFWPLALIFTSLVKWGD